MSSTWAQLEQLLTCCICLDRYRNPRLLPCQHSFCSEPCLDGLVDYARRQIKCPECRAEHRLPYSGEPNFPANFTLMRFLELYQQVTGEEPEPLPSMLERCAVCSEKAEVKTCAHCEKRVCLECRAAHTSILRRELQRLNAQIRRALARLQDELGQLSKCESKLKGSCETARVQLDQLAEQLVNAVQDKRRQLLHELDEFQLQEQCSLTKLREIIGEEYESLLSNCELIEKHVLEPSAPGAHPKSHKESTLKEYDAGETVDNGSSDMVVGAQADWTDQELLECRDIYLRTLEFLRHFETLDSLEYARKAMKLDLHAELDLLRKNVTNFAMLRLQMLASDCLQSHLSSAEHMAAVHSAAAAHLNLSSNASIGSGIGSAVNLAVPGSALSVAAAGSQQSSSLLMRSQSDHRLAAQFAKKEATAAAAAAAGIGGPGAGGPMNRYGNYAAYDAANEYSPAHYHPAGSNPAGSMVGGGGVGGGPGSGAGFAFKSRFMREKGAEIGLYEDEASEYGTGRVRFDEHGGGLSAGLMGHHAPANLATIRLFENKQTTRAPLSHIVKLADSLHLVERLDEQKRKMLKAEKEAKEPASDGNTVSGNNSMMTQHTRPVGSNVHASTNVNSNVNSNLTSGTPISTPDNATITRNRLPATRQLSEDEIEKQKRLNKQLEQQQLQQQQQQQQQQVKTQQQATTLLQHTPAAVATVTQVHSRTSTLDSTPRNPLTSANSVGRSTVARHRPPSTTPAGRANEEDEEDEDEDDEDEEEDEDEDEDDEEEEEDDEVRSGDKKKASSKGGRRQVLAGGEMMTNGHVNKTDDDSVLNGVSIRSSSSSSSVSASTPPETSFGAVTSASIKPDLPIDSSKPVVTNGSISADSSGIDSASTNTTSTTARRNSGTDYSYPVYAGTKLSRQNSNASSNGVTTNGGSVGINHSTSNGLNSVSSGGTGVGGIVGAVINSSNGNGGSVNSSNVDRNTGYSSTNSPVYLTPRNSIDHGSGGNNSTIGSQLNSRSNSFDRDGGSTTTSGSGYRYLTRANTRLDDLLSRDYSDTSTVGSSGHSRFNRLNRLARSSTVSSLSPSYTTTSSGVSNAGSSAYSSSRGYEPSSYTSTGSGLYGSNTGSTYGSSATSGSSGNNYLSMRSRPSSPPPPLRSAGGSPLGSTNRSSTGSGTSAGSGLSRYSIGNSSVGTSSYRRSSAYTPDTSLYGSSSRWQRSNR